MDLTDYAPSKNQGAKSYEKQEQQVLKYKSHRNKKKFIFQMKNQNTLNQDWKL